MDKLDLLDQLQHDDVNVGTTPDLSPRPRRPKPWLALTAVAVITAAGSYLSIDYLDNQSAVQVQAYQSDMPAQPVSEPEKAPLNAIAPAEDGVSLNAAGYIIATKRATVAANTTGRVDQILISEGQKVEKGQLIARLDDRALVLEVNRAQSDLRLQKLMLQELEVAHQESLRQHQRENTLFKKGLISDARLDELSAELKLSELAIARTKEQIEGVRWQLRQKQHLLADTEIRAPFAGVAVSIAAQEGEIVSPLSAGSSHTRTGIATIVDMSSLQVEADISETYLSKIEKGQSVTLDVNSFPGEAFQGQVATILPTADRQTATVKVRISLAEHYDGLLPEMATQVAFLSESAHTFASVAPTTAVQQRAQ